MIDPLSKSATMTCLTKREFGYIGTVGVIVARLLQAHVPNSLHAVKQSSKIAPKYTADFMIVRTRPPGLLAVRLCTNRPFRHSLPAIISCGFRAFGHRR